MNGYSATLEYLYGLEKSGIVFGLDNIHWILSLIDNPHDLLKTIHIGGTNGKGSVARISSAVLREAGYRVGCYTSPHLVSFTERIAVDDVQISEAETVELTEFIKGRVEAADPSRRFTFFDFTTALAFEYFRRKKVDLAVIEVGLGGRLDSTNVIHPLVSVVTNVDFDHMDYLGDSINEIAVEKAGILKHGVPCVTGAEGTSLEVIREAAQQKCPLYVLNEAFHYRKTGDQVMSYQGLENAFSDLRINLVGDHQLSNCALALCTLELLARAGFTAKEEAIRLALAGLTWPGRLEKVHTKPLILLDAAHNPHGAKALASYLGTHCSDRRKILIFGVMKDKNFASMLAELAPLADEILLTRPRTERAALTEDLIPFARNATVTETISDALKRAREITGDDDLIVITGSFYTIGEARTLIDEVF
ncbi:MAG TPA: folylpolyglutamate synthase/dihydrofolate synthase family protein [Syntrophorhabdales bacterium]|nr:folylpolyglutamate synthase/dihydrofolate synthase family protein [Syntrophorhabdales bacterium]